MVAWVMHNVDCVWTGAPLPLYRLLRRAKGGFTLLEMVLALALGVALLAILYVAVRLHLTIAAEEPEEVNLAQEVRSALEMLCDDLQHVVVDPPGLSSATVGNSGTSSSSESAGTADASASISDGLQASSSSAGSGLWGDRQTLVLYRVLLPRDLDLGDKVSSSGTFLPRPALYRIAYYVGERLDEEGGTTYILYRYAVPYGLESLADQLPPGSPGLDLDRPILSRLTFVEFRFFDGVQWSSQWGDLGPVRPPLAVEVTLGLSTRAVRNTTSAVPPWASLRGIPAGSYAFRRVVYVPGVEEDLVSAIGQAAGF
jgi:prepilin-type N-terminal cleavage/methylation domain-containing protein